MRRKSWKETAATAKPPTIACRNGPTEESRPIPISHRNEADTVCSLSALVRRGKLGDGRSVDYRVGIEVSGAATAGVVAAVSVFAFAYVVDTAALLRLAWAPLTGETGSVR